MGKSDPYVRVIVGSQEFKSPVIYNTINPKWNYICEVIVHDIYGQNIDIEVMDEDQGSKDDFLGRTYLSLQTISIDGITEAWLTLKDTKKGSLHVRTTWLSLSNSLDHLSDQLKESKLIKHKYESTVVDGKTAECDKQPFGSVAAVLVYLDCARNLPVISKTSGEPSPYTVISLGNQKRHSIVKNCTSNPVWEETFNFLVDDLNTNLELRTELFDSKTNKQLGTSNLKLKDVFSCENLCFNQPLPIQGRGTDCEINLIVMIRVLKAPKVQQTPKLTIEEPNEDNEETNVPTLEDMVKGTIQPIIDTSGIGQDIIETSQKERKNSVRKGNGYVFQSIYIFIKNLFIFQFEKFYNYLFIIFFHIIG
jgi:hypothetical protein